MSLVSKRNVFLVYDNIGPYLSTQLQRPIAKILKLSNSNNKGAGLLFKAQFVSS